MAPGRARAFVAVCLALASWACGPAPARVISLGASVSELLVDLGAAGEVVGASSETSLPAALGNAVRLGGSLEERHAAARALRPTLAVGTSRDRALLARLEADGTPTLVVRGERMDDVMRSTLALGIRVGREREALALVRERTQQLAQLSARAGRAPRPRVAWVVGREPLVVVGGASLLHTLIEIAGGENPFELPPAPRRSVSPGDLAAARLDVLLDGTLEAGEAGDPDARRAAAARWGKLLDGPRVAFLPRAASELPALDVLRRARLIHARIHGDVSPNRPAPAGSGGRLSPRLP